MNEDQKAWIEALKAIVNSEREDSPAAYEALIGKVQQHIDAAPEP